MTELICTNCHYVGTPKRLQRGSKSFSRALWMVFPFNLPYAVWRMFSYSNVCSHCGNTNLIATDSALGKQLMDKFEAKILNMYAAEGGEFASSSKGFTREEKQYTADSFKGENIRFNQPIDEKAANAAISPKSVPLSASTRIEKPAEYDPSKPHEW